MAALGALYAAFQFMQMFPSIGHELQYVSYGIHPNAPIDPASLVTMRFKGILDEGGFKDRMRRVGFGDDASDKIFQGARQMLGAGESVRARWRGIINEEEYYQEMARVGFDHDKADLVERVSRFFPSPGDLVRFAVREVYTPDIVSQYGMMEDLPPEFLTEAAKAGLGEEQARNYWGAHWELPSVGMGYEMLHRGIITMEEMQTLLRTLDVMPYWREKLIGISYHPYARVDVRRLYRTGVIDREEVKRNYLDLGYDEVHAENLTIYTELEARGSEKDLSMTMVLRALEVGEIDRGTAIDDLIGLGYSEDEADTITTIYEYKWHEAELDDEIGVLLKEFTIERINDAQLSDSLDGLNLDSGRKEKVMRKAVLSRRGKVTLPAKADLETWLKKAIINTVGFKDGMRQLGYRASDVDKYLLELGH